MNQDLKVIKNKYGEKMMHLCRILFPTILETEGALSKILLEKFEPSRFLYEDIIENKIEEEFKKYIYSVFDSSFRKTEVESDKTPSELMDEAGYILYECKTESDIQSFKKYYKSSEELCTFNGDRLDRCHVYFAVKKNVDDIKRENFKNPQRQDLYGTSVISIQFTKDDSHILSIKNRYNHTVANPDATFGNNLDNIIPGLADSFEVYCGMKQKVRSSEFEIPGYVMANDGKYYKYNYEIYNIYYCPNNIIICNFEAKRYPKEQYIVMDYFVLDLKSGNVKVYDLAIDESFGKTMKDVGKPVVYNEGDYKKIFFNKDGQESAVIILDKCNNIVSIENKNINEIPRNFLIFNEKLEKINLPNTEVIGESFLINNKKIKEINLPNVKDIKMSFLISDEALEKIILPNVKRIGDNFLYKNINLTELSLPNVKEIGTSFLEGNEKLEKIYLPNVEYIGHFFMRQNKNLKKLDLPKVRTIRWDALLNNEKLEIINLPKLENIYENFLYSNTELKEIYLPKVKDISYSFLYNNKKLEKISVRNSNIIPEHILENNPNLKIEIVEENIKK